MFSDERGKLTLVPLDSIPFEASRAYVLSELPRGGRRAGHACRTQHRFLVCVSGSVRVTLDDGREPQWLELGPGDTIHVPPAVWLELETLLVPAHVLVFADGEYDPDDYVSDRSQLPLECASAPVTLRR